MAAPGSEDQAMDRFSRRQRASAGMHLAVSLLTGILAGGALAKLTNGTVGALCAWVVAAAVFLVWTWTAVWPLDANDTATLAAREDPSRALSDLVLLATALLSLVVVALVIFRAGHSSGPYASSRLGLGVAAVVASWATVHTVFMLQYAWLYYSGKAGGITFNQEAPPRYSDFAYLAFTVGMTFQVSDPTVNDSRIRAAILRHSLLSFLFGTVIIAVTINLVAGLSK